MLTIQQAGKEILTNTPTKFYIFSGDEFGIKSKYINVLKSYYNSYKECNKVSDVINIMQHKHIVPLKPSLYIVRYDEEFYSKLSNTTSNLFQNLNIIGTLVCIYSSKHTNKLNKYLPNYTVSFDEINSNLILSYLKKDYKHIPNNLLEYVSKYANDYSQANILCTSLTNLDSDISKISCDEVAKLFGIATDFTDETTRCIIASKNFNSLIYMIDNCDNLDNIYYTILNVMTELEKILTSKYSDSVLRPYSKYWTMSDVYNFFKHTYSELVKTRKISSYSVYNSLVYLFTLLQYSRVPSLEAFQ